MVKKLIALGAAALLVAGDQILKFLVIHQIKPVGSVDVWPGVLQLRYVENEGVAFGMLAGARWIMVGVTSLMCLILLLFLLLYRRHTGLSLFASVLIIAGGVGNIIDRVILGYVVDYISVSFFPPVFNFADCCIVVGVVLLLIYFFFFQSEKDQHEKLICTRPHNYRNYRR